VLSAIMVVICYLLFMMWVNTKFSNPELVNEVNQNLIERLKAGIPYLFPYQRKTLLIVIMYVGVFVLPLLPLLILTALPIVRLIKARWLQVFPFLSGNKKNLFFYGQYILIAGAILFSYIFTRSNPVTSIQNVLYNCGLGPLLFRDTSLLRLNIEGFEIPLSIFRVISFTGMLASILLLFFFVSFFIISLKKSYKETATARDKFFQLLFISSAIYLFLLVNVPIFDRYILVLVPMALLMYAIILMEITKPMQVKYFVVSWVMVALIVVFEVLATHDYLAWNRAKWQALNHLTGDLKISPKEIDGGYEFNGIHNYDVHYVSSQYKSWWWVIDDKYILTMGMLPGYSEYFKMPYDCWLFNKTKYVRVLKRQ
jgi:hypothetical protein